MDKKKLKDIIYYLSNEQGFVASVIEKDFHLTRILNRVNEYLSDDIVFKGGTLLNKVYLNYHRLSEDLDFVYRGEVDLSTRGKRSKGIRPIRERIPAFKKRGQASQIHKKGNVIMNHSEIKVGIVCPLDIEYETCKEILKLNAETELAGRYISSRKEKGIEVLAVKAGVGKINCSSATQLIIGQFQPDFIIDAGVAGSLTEDLKINDIVCVIYSYEYGPYTGKTLGKIPPEDDISCAVISKSFYKKAFKEFTDHIRHTMGITIRAGHIACSEKDVKDRNFRKTLQNNFNALACDWETSAVLHTANLNRVKGFSFRVISDLADENMQDSFDKNCKPALQKLFPVVNDFIFKGWINHFCGDK